MTAQPAKPRSAFPKTRESQARVGLQLSGHTHDGQINLLVNPADWLLKNGWVAGLYREQGSQLYVNRGFGTVGPGPHWCPPEVRASC